MIFEIFLKFSGLFLTFPYFSVEKGGFPKKRGVLHLHEHHCIKLSIKTPKNAFNANFKDFRTFPMISGLFQWFPDFSYDFRTFPMISGLFLWFPDISCDFRIFPMISGLFQWFPDFSCDFRTFPVITYDIRNFFFSFPDFSWLFRTFLWKRGGFPKKRGMLHLHEHHCIYFFFFVELLKIKWYQKWDIH